MLVIIHGINVQTNREIARQSTSVGLGQNGSNANTARLSLASTKPD